MRNRVILALVAVGAAVAVWVWQVDTTAAQQSSTPAPAPGGNAPPSGPPPVPVTADKVKREDYPISKLGLGSVQAYNTVTVHVRVDGALDKVAFTEGQDVKAGDLLAQIDPRPFQATLDQVAATKAKDEAQLANAERDLDRYISLAPQNFTSKQTLDTQRALVAQLNAQVKVDQATIDSAKVQLGYTTVSSPLDGRTGIRLVDQGNIVHATDAGGLVVITQLHPISLVFTLSETLLPQISRVMAAGPLKVEAWSQDDSVKLDTGTVALIDNQIDPTTGTMKLKATFQNQKEALWPGQFVNARLLLETRHDGTTVPVQTVQRGPNGTFAWVVKPDQTVEMRPIKVADANSQTALIETGVEPDEIVVVDGQYRLVVGGKVTVTMAGPKQTAAAEPQKQGTMAEPQKQGTMAEPQKQGTMAEPQKQGTMAEPQKQGTTAEPQK
jgi:multidrug efflux system membrane fusion protein